MRRKGFTLLELLIVVAIIGVLSAMLFPMFAQERAALRDTRCIANVKAIATAIRRYAEDYEELWPGERDARAHDYFTGVSAGEERVAPTECGKVRLANPYLRPAVILDRYLESRQVWSCPRATTLSRAVWIVPAGPDGDWLQGYRDHQGEWGRSRRWRAEEADDESAQRSSPAVSEPRGSARALRGLSGHGGPCLSAFPPGWGGAITDSFVQGAGSVRMAAEAPERSPRAFAQAIATNAHLTDLKLSRVGNPSKYLVCGDSSVAFEVAEINKLAFPDTCAVHWCGSPDCGYGLFCAKADWGNCPETRVCGLPPEAESRLLTNAKYRQSFARHRGGANVGFLDGHAKWYATDFLLKHSEPFKYQAFEGHLCSCWPGNGKVPEEVGTLRKKAAPKTQRDQRRVAPCLS